MDTKQRLWKTRIAEWNESGLSQRRFCREREYSLSAFRYWKGRLEGAGPEQPREEFTLVSAPSLATSPEAGDDGPSVSVAVGRYTVSLAGGFDLRDLTRLLDLLESR